jgi:hypothetical protein
MVAGCSHDGGDMEADESPVILSNWDGGVGLDALAIGNLTLVDGCLVTTNVEFPGEYGLLAFPRAFSSWDAATQVLTYNGHEFHMGDAVAAGGGGTSNIDGLTVPDACRALVEQRVNVFVIMDTNIAP